MSGNKMVNLFDLVHTIKMFHPTDDHGNLSTESQMYMTFKFIFKPFFFKLKNKFAPIR